MNLIPCSPQIFEKLAFSLEVGATGVVLGAVYMLWMIQRVIFGPIEKSENKALRDIGPREWGLLIPVVILIFWIGLYPKPFLRKMDASVKHLIEQVRGEEMLTPPPRPNNTHDSPGTGH